MLINIFEKHSCKNKVRASEMSSSLRKQLAVWSCPEIVVQWWCRRWWEKVEKQMMIALNLVKQLDLECHGVTLFLECWQQVLYLTNLNKSNIRRPNLNERQCWWTKGICRSQHCDRWKKFDAVYVQTVMISLEDADFIISCEVPADRQ